MIGEISFYFKAKRHTINNLIWSLTVNSFKNEQISISNNRNLLWVSFQELIATQLKQYQIIKSSFIAQALLNLFICNLDWDASISKVHPFFKKNVPLQWERLLVLLQRPHKTAVRMLKIYCIILHYMMTWMMNWGWWFEWWTGERIVNL